MSTRVDKLVNIVYCETLNEFISCIDDDSWKILD